MPIKFRRNSLQYFHHHSFEYFMQVLVPQILSSEHGHLLERGHENNLMWTVCHHFDEPYFLTPSTGKTVLTPRIAKENGMTYTMQLRVRRYRQVLTICRIETLEVVEKREIHPESDVLLGNIPVMVHSPYCSLEFFPGKYDSRECKFDEGGYFIVNGQKKQVIPHETQKANHILVFQKRQNGQVVSYAQVRSVHLDQQDMISPLSIECHNGRIMVFTSKLQDNSQTGNYGIPLCVLLRALGMQSDKEILNHICMGNSDKALLMEIWSSFQTYRTTNEDEEPCLEDIVNTIEQAQLELLRYVRKSVHDAITTPMGKAKRMLCLEKIFRDSLLPHLGKNASLLDKARFICLMVNKLMQVVLGRVEPDDRDSYANKKVILIGELMGFAFKRAFKNQLREAKYYYIKQMGNRLQNLENKIYPDLSKNIKIEVMDKMFELCISKGEWPFGMTHIQKGVSMPLTCQTRADTLSMQVRIKTPVADSNTKSTANRLYHNTQAFIFAPLETPEGQSTGLHKHLSLTVETTLPDQKSAEVILEILADPEVMIPIQSLKPVNYPGKVHIFVNGNWLGFLINPTRLHRRLRDLRFKGTIHRHVSFWWSGDFFHVSTMGGRYKRPLFVVESNELVVSLSALHEIVKKAQSWEEVYVLASGGIEFLDVDELMHTMIAMTPSDLIFNDKDRKAGARFKAYSHCELHPFLMFGRVGSNIPYLEYNHSTRIMFQTSHGRQAIGQPNTNYRHECNETLVYAMNNMQRPIVQTHASPWLHMTELPAGQNVVIAIMTYTGFNQEDAIIINRDSLDAGLFRIAKYQNYENSQQRGLDTGKLDRFEKPHPEMVGNMKGTKQYEKMGKDGFVPLETPVSDMDAIIGKTTPIYDARGGKPFRDSSTFIRGNTSGVVDKTMSVFTKTKEERRIVRIRSVRTPMVGDKLGSRCGQKGTVGLILPRRDMPRTASGVVPDIIINPHCLPSRMTAGFLLEILIGKLGADECNIINATAFTGLNLEGVYKRLEQRGFDRHGLTPMTNGMTGEPIIAEVFIGSAFYQRLKHMVVDKVHARSEGPIQPFVRQPTQGRAKGGGLRIGEMERDAIIAHGTSDFLRERLMRSSDETTMHICRACGWFAHKDWHRDRYICPYCKNTTMISEVKAPYVFKLFLQNLKTINISSKIRISNRLLD